MLQLALAPHHYTLYLTIFNVLWGIFALVVGTGITSSTSTLGGEYSFSSNGICFGGVVVIYLSLHVVLVLRMLLWSLCAAPTSEVAGSYFSFFSTIFFCVSVVSSFFYVICPWKIFVSFLIASSFSVHKVENRAAGAVFFSVMIKFVAACVAELEE